MIMHKIWIGGIVGVIVGAGGLYMYQKYKASKSGAPATNS